MCSIYWKNKKWRVDRLSNKINDLLRKQGEAVCPDWDDRERIKSFTKEAIHILRKLCCEGSRKINNLVDSEGVKQ